MASISRIATVSKYFRYFREMLDASFTDLTSGDTLVYDKGSWTNVPFTGVMESYNPDFYVPYTDATKDVDLGDWSLYANTVTTTDKASFGGTVEFQYGSPAFAFTPSGIERAGMTFSRRGFPFNDTTMTWYANDFAGDPYTIFQYVYTQFGGLAVFYDELRITPGGGAPGGTLDVSHGYFTCGNMMVYNQDWPLVSALEIQVNASQTAPVLSAYGNTYHIAYIPSHGECINFSTEVTAFDLLWGDWNTFNSAFLTSAISGYKPLGMGSIIQDDTVSPTGYSIAEIAPAYNSVTDTYSAYVYAEAYSDYSSDTYFEVALSSKNAGKPDVPASATMLLRSDGDVMFTIDGTGSSTYEGPFFVVNALGNQIVNVDHDAIRLGGALPTSPAIAEPALYIKNNRVDLGAAVYINSADDQGPMLVAGSPGSIYNATIDQYGGIQTRYLSLYAVSDVSDTAVLDGKESVILLSTSGSSYSVTLPAVSTVPRGRLFIFKVVANSGADVVTITPDDPGETIDGATSYDISTVYSALTLMANSDEWLIVASNYDIL